MQYFSQTCPSKITVHLVGNDLSLDCLAMKADAIQMELNIYFRNTMMMQVKMFVSTWTIVYHHFDFPAHNH